MHPKNRAAWRPKRNFSGNQFTKPSRENAEGKTKEANEEACGSNNLGQHTVDGYPHYGPGPRTTHGPVYTLSLRNISGSSAPRRFVPRLRRFVSTFDQFVPNPLVDSYPTNYDTKCLQQTNIYFNYPSNRKTIKMHARTSKVYV